MKRVAKLRSAKNRVADEAKLRVGRQQKKFEVVALGDRLTVGQVPLEHFVQVRILVAQPEFRNPA